MSSRNLNRRFSRVPFASTIALWRDRQPQLLQAMDLSAGGVFVSMDRSISEGTLLTLRLGLPGESGFTVLARAVRNAIGRGPIGRKGVAFEFVDIAPRDRARVERYVSRFLNAALAI